ncbi:hypothetical protein CNBG_2559 [Cryptococcus deuterogattii R265]|uniref:uncharacterized protein n=1 Tax=Cryptococcus deuterogattii (strain R265) TaxID=294750 RepID=UPI0019380DCF|nr:hypothetical protein CNBG_2559 [Cryptococcus deuterogattii R265]
MLPTHSTRSPISTYPPSFSQLLSPRTSHSFPSSQLPHHPPALPQNSNRRSSRRKRKKFTLKTFQSILYHSSFWLCIIIETALLVGAAWGLGEQAWHTGPQQGWNIVVLAAAYAVFLIITVTHAWSRYLSVKQIMKTMPKPYMPIKPDDVPEKVSRHIATEYSRTAVISHISQATQGEQDGWGRPGTKWEATWLREYILGTVGVMKEALGVGDGPPLSLEPFYEAADRLNDSGAVRLLVNSWAKYVEKARYGKKEPNEREAGAVERLVEVVVLTMEIKRQKKENK